MQQTQEQESEGQQAFMEPLQSHGSHSNPKSNPSSKTMESWKPLALTSRHKEPTAFASAKLMVSLLSAFAVMALLITCYRLSISEQGISSEAYRRLAANRDAFHSRLHSDASGICPEMEAYAQLSGPLSHSVPQRAEAILHSMEFTDFGMAQQPTSVDTSLPSTSGTQQLPDDDALDRSYAIELYLEMEEEAGILSKMDRPVPERDVAIPIIVDFLRSAEKSPPTSMKTSLPSKSTSVPPVFSPKDYVLPVLEEHAKIERPFDPRKAFSPTILMKAPGNAVKQMHVYFRRQSLTPHDAQSIINLSERLVNYMCHFQKDAIPEKVHQAAIVLGRRFIFFDCLVSAIEVLGPAMNPDKWWRGFAASIPVDFEGGKPDSMHNSSSGSLTKTLIKALRKLVEGKRASQQKTLLLKNDLFHRTRHSKYGFYLTEPSDPN